MNNSIVSDKKNIRHSLRAKRKSIGKTERQQIQKQITRQLLPLIKRNSNIAAYMAFGSELDLSDFIRIAQKRGAKIWMPYIEKRQRRLWFSAYQSQAKNKEYAYGIVQFAGKKRRIESMQLVLVPLLGVDKTGIRMGQGGGYYDKSLSYCDRASRPKLIGVGFACQKVASLPKEPWDRALDAFICEEGVSYFSCHDIA
ncbi:5-formyltetrahydrofolate cyclo-ligase [Neisseria sp. Ec49-e6-T10]|uniref:5-formyltetrahydrofolate cyclo-ligase n=1 Tax=Neisseria sp. Ec49-e6-T10 TaxID=3140744 RepID=UPI003EBFB8F9